MWIPSDCRRPGFSVGNESFAYTVAPDDENQEHIAAAVVRVGTSVVTLRLQGGRALSATVLQRLSRDVVAKLRQSCDSHA